MADSTTERVVWGLQGTTALPGKGSTFGRIVATFLTSLAYIFMKVLVLILRYHPGTYRWVEEEDAAPRVWDTRHKTRLIRFFVDQYHRSYYYDRMIRAGYRCRFIPSCSDYAIRAVEKYGYRRGLHMACGRFRRCLPHNQIDYIDFP